MADELRIAGLELAATHDGEAAVLLRLRDAHGGESRVQISSRELLQVMQRAGVTDAGALIGCPWTVLCLQPVLGPKPLPPDAS